MESCTALTCSFVQEHTVSNIVSILNIFFFKWNIPGKHAVVEVKSLRICHKIWLKMENEIVITACWRFCEIFANIFSMMMADMIDIPALIIGPRK